MPAGRSTTANCRPKCLYFSLLFWWKFVHLCVCVCTFAFVSYAVCSAVARQSDVVGAAGDGHTNTTKIFLCMCVCVCWSLSGVATSSLHGASYCSHLVTSCLLPPPNRLLSNPQHSAQLRSIVCIELTPLCHFLLVFFYYLCCVLLQHLPFTVARHLRFRRRWRAVTTVSAAVCGCAPLGVRLSASQQPLTSATLFCFCCSIFLLVRLPCVVSFYFVSFVCYSTSLACKANSFHFIALFFHSHFVIFTMHSYTHTHKHIHLYTVFTCSTFFQTLTSLMHFADLSCHSFFYFYYNFLVLL